MAAPTAAPMGPTTAPIMAPVEPPAMAPMRVRSSFMTFFAVLTTLARVMGAEERFLRAAGFAVFAAGRADVRFFVVTERAAFFVVVLRVVERGVVLDGMVRVSGILPPCGERAWRA